MPNTTTSLHLHKPNFGFIEAPKRMAKFGSRDGQVLYKASDTFAILRRITLFMLRISRAMHWKERESYRRAIQRYVPGSIADFSHDVSLLGAILDGNILISNT